MLIPFILGSGTSRVLSWHHRQFVEAAAARYLAVRLLVFCLRLYFRLISHHLPHFNNDNVSLTTPQDPDVQRVRANDIADYFLVCLALC